MQQNNQETLHVKHPLLRRQNVFPSYAHSNMQFAWSTAGRGNIGNVSSTYFDKCDRRLVVGDKCEECGHFATWSNFSISKDNLAARLAEQRNDDKLEGVK
eukprot:scaffold168089_cov18-Prasinocladus_malaysianus.AAC.1